MIKNLRRAINKGDGGNGGDRSVNEVSTDHQEDASQLHEDTGKTKKSGKSKGGNAGRMFGRGAYEDIP